MKRQPQLRSAKWWKLARLGVERGDAGITIREGADATGEPVQPIARLLAEMTDVGWFERRRRKIDQAWCPYYVATARLREEVVERPTPMSVSTTPGAFERLANAWHGR